MRRRPAQLSAPTSGFAGFCFPPDVIMVAICSYITYGLSHRDVEELLAEREPLHIQELTPRIHTVPPGGVFGLRRIVRSRSARSRSLY